MPAKKFLVLIGAIIVVPLAVLLWLGWRLVEQDRQIEATERQQHLERAADLVVAALQRSVSESLRRLASEADDWPEGAVAVTFRDAGLKVRPRGRVAFLPQTPALPEAAPGNFTDGDRLEFQEHDRTAAIQIFRELAKSTDPAIRAVGFLRLGRNLKDTDGALAAYAQLSKIDDAAIGGVPAGLLGIYARCQLLEKDKRLRELRVEAAYLAGQIYAGRWNMPAPVYWLYASDAARWTGAVPQSARQREVWANAVGKLWENRQSIPATVASGDEKFAVVWQISADAKRALIASPGFVRDRWMPAAQAIAKEQEIAFQVGGATAGIRRKAGDTGLPWDISAANLDLPGDRAFAQRKQLLIAGFVTLAFLAIAAGYMIFRAVSRELAAVRMQSDFISAVSHEFRTPLTALRQFTAMLRENAHLSEERRRLCYDAQERATDRLMGLVESLLDFGRMEAGAHRYRFEHRDCGELVHRTVEDFRATSQAAGFEIEFISGEPAGVDADAEALGRALRNLLENAVKYSAERCDVEVRVCRKNGDVRIAVRDHGIGVPAHERGKIFVKFHRGEQARTRGIKGTGIGLAMVDEIIKAHHGRVEVESEPGRGSTFTIVLPVKE